MADWGAANGPNDTRSHAQMMMESVLRKGRDPHQPCDCGGEYEELSHQSPPEALLEYQCTDCGTLTYEWRDKHKNRQPDEYKW